MTDLANGVDLQASRRAKNINKTRKGKRERNIGEIRMTLGGEKTGKGYHLYKET